jgi:hypothetical protein
MPATARHARQEAQEVIGDTRFARVLEPSPPPLDDGDFFADDPVRAPAPKGSAVVGPVPGDDVDRTWNDWLAEPGHDRHGAWAADRWLGAYRRLPAATPTLVETRLALHRLAVYVISPARRRANTKIGLRFTMGGFGTPFFGADEQARVEGTVLVRQRAGGSERDPVSTIEQAAKFMLDGPPDVEWAQGFDVPPVGDVNEQLAVDPAAAAFLGDWYGFGWSVLEELRADAGSTDAGRVQLWPEHFDAAFDCLPEDRRITLGASPGDAAVPEPYLYALPWKLDWDDPELWNAAPFRGAILPLSGFADAPDQRATALEFLRWRREALAQRTSNA